MAVNAGRGAGQGPAAYHAPFRAGGADEQDTRPAAEKSRSRLFGPGKKSWRRS